MEIAGLPLHPLVVHATVVLAPLAALTVIVFAVVPRWRWLTRWPALVGAVVAAASGVAASVTGNAFLDSRPELEPLVEDHKDFGGTLVLVLIGFAVLVVVGAWALSSRTPLPSGRGARDAPVAALDKVIPVVLVLAAVGVVVLVVLTGHSGSDAVWGG